MAKRILVADDEVAIRDATMIHLDRAGYESISAGDGCEILDLIQAHSSGKSPIDLILLDLQMPGCCGLEMIASLRDIKGCPPIVVMSGTVDSTELDEAGKDVNCHGVLSKPFRAEQLLRIIADALAKD